MSYLSKNQGKAQPSAAGGPVLSEGILARMPALAEFLTAVVDDDGNERQTATLLVIADASVFKVALNDREMSRSLWASGSTLEKALETLEYDLETGEGEWRAAFGAKRKK